MVSRPSTIQKAPVVAAPDRFLIAKNPDEASSLKYLVRIPLDGGVILKVRDTWPKTARVYCHPVERVWPDPVELVDDVQVVSCRRRGPAIDLVLCHPTIGRKRAGTGPARAPGPIVASRVRSESVAPGRWGSWLRQ